MSNIIQIKRGAGAPSNGQLAPYELGYDVSGKGLYIGDMDGSAIKLGQGNALIPTTTLMKSRNSKKEAQKLQIYCYNLKPNTNYSIYLYTMQKSRGNASRYWRHPANTSEGVYQGKYCGYANLVAEAAVTGEDYPDIPDWMPHSGVLQTEWNFSTEAHEYSKVYEIDLNEWIADLMKPNLQGNDEWTMMGISSKNPRKTSRQFQFKIVSSDGSTEAIGDTNNTLCLSGVERRYQGEVQGYQIHINFFSIK